MPVRSRALSLLLVLVLVSTAALVAGCGEGDSVDAKGAVAACNKACDKQVAACPGYNACRALCNAYEITTDTQACADAIIAEANCEEAQTYTCVMNYPLAGDIHACDAQRQAHTDACK